MHASTCGGLRRALIRSATLDVVAPSRVAVGEAWWWWEEQDLRVQGRVASAGFHPLP